MRILFLYATTALFVLGCLFALIAYNETHENMVSLAKTDVHVIPIEHATAVIGWGDTTIYTDPVGGASAFDGQQSPDIILLTDIHGDHLNADTLSSVSGEATLIAPQAVKDALPASLASRITVMRNGETHSVQGFTVLATPMYNVPESNDAFHTKGRGNGYIVEKNGFRVLIAGDTGNTQELRALKDIDIALIPMNLPYTMSVEEAANAVLAFKPKTVYPYHYRGPDGLADVARFKQLVNENDPTIEVVLADWYPAH
jgi:L-ascorbate metabolism protein UlaG (beta-lactamase superfamily)